VKSRILTPHILLPERQLPDLKREARRRGASNARPAGRTAGRLLSGVVCHGSAGAPAAVP
jgi:hypothetical protein